MEVVRTVGLEAFCDGFHVKLQQTPKNKISKDKDVAQPLLYDTTTDQKIALVSHRRARLTTRCELEESYITENGELSAQTLPLSTCTQPRYPGRRCGDTPASPKAEASTAGKGSEESTTDDVKNYHDCMEHWKVYRDEFFLLNHWLSTPREQDRPNMLFYGLGSKQFFLDTLTTSCLCTLIPTVAVFRALHPAAHLRRFLTRVIRKLRHSQGINDTSCSKNVLDLKEELLSIVDKCSGSRRHNHPRRLSAFLAAAAFGATSPTRRRLQAFEDAKTLSCFGADPPALCLVVHNLEAPSLRIHQPLLAELAAHPKILLVASVDHIRYPLLWNSNDIVRFQFLHFDVSTCEDYRKEVEWGWRMGTPQWLLQSRETQRLSVEAAQNALSAMPPKHKELYCEIARLAIQQYASSSSAAEDPSHPPSCWARISRQRILQRSRHQMLYMDVLKFNAALHEFVDHRLLLDAGFQALERGGVEATADGSVHKTYYTVPLDRAALITLYPTLADQDDGEEEEDAPAC